MLFASPHQYSLECASWRCSGVPQDDQWVTNPFDSGPCVRAFDPVRPLVDAHCGHSAINDTGGLYPERLSSFQRVLDSARVGW
jgi:hypothetical protein